MLLHFALDHLTVALLNALEVLVGLLQLAASVVDQGPSADNLASDLADDAGYNFNLARIQVSFVDALSAQEGVLKPLHYRGFDLHVQVGMQNAVHMLGTLHA